MRSRSNFTPFSIVTFISGLASGCVSSVSGCGSTHGLRTAGALAPGGAVGRPVCDGFGRGSGPGFGVGSGIGVRSEPPALVGSDPPTGLASVPVSLGAPVSRGATVSAIAGRPVVGEESGAVRPVPVPVGAPSGRTTGPVTGAPGSRTGTPSPVTGAPGSRVVTTSPGVGGTRVPGGATVSVRAAPRPLTFTYWTVPSRRPRPNSITIADSRSGPPRLVSFMILSRSWRKVAGIMNSFATSIPFARGRSR